MPRAALTWKIHWPFTLLCAVFLLLFLLLGDWQLHRAAEKRVAQARFEAGRNAAPLALSQLPPDAALFTRVAMTGRYDNDHNFLLDNRIMHGRFGYEVVTPFQPLHAAQPILVDRGWVAGDPSRQLRPAIAPVTGEVRIVGSVYRDTARFHFFDNTRETVWPRLIQSLRLDDLQAQLGRGLTPFVIRIDPDYPGAYLAEWRIFSPGFGPERHVSYAVTWFAMAFVLVVMWLLHSSNVRQWLRGSRPDEE